MNFLHGFAWGLITLGSILAVLNWLTLYKTWRTGRFCSPVPFIGALFLGGGMLLIPQTRPFAWLALVLDYGTLMFLRALPRVVDELWKTSRFNLSEEFVGQKDNRLIRLRLFRKGVFTIEQRFTIERDECGMIRAGNIGEWKRENGRLMLWLEGDPYYTFEPFHNSGYEGLLPVNGCGGDKHSTLSMKGVELRLKYRTANCI